MRREYRSYNDTCTIICIVVHSINMLNNIDAACYANNNIIQ